MHLLDSIQRLASTERLLFLVSGGHAVIAHGAPRNTFDLDLIVRREDSHAWIQLLAGLDYKPIHETPVFLQFEAVKTSGLPLDLMLVNSETFLKLAAEAILNPAGTPEAKFVGLEHLVALKCHALKHGHARRAVKDFNDLIMLAEANHLDYKDEEWRNLILKHGTPELYDQLRKI